jgi:WD40 repeat protein
VIVENQEEFYSVTLGDDIVGGGGVGNITFWDLRNKKEVGNFSDSFNEEVTHLYLDAKTLYGCSLDGLVGCFDITKSEEDGTEWTYRFSNPVDGLRLQNGHVLAHTADHHLGLIRDGELIKKYSPNSP